MEAKEEVITGTSPWRADL